MARSWVACTVAGLLICCCFTFSAPAQIGRRARTPIPIGPKIAAADVRPAFMSIRIENDLISAEIVATPLPNVLEEIAARTGVVFEIGSQDATPVSVSFYRVNLQEAVERLVQNNNSIFYYSETPSGENRIDFVRIFTRGEQPKQPSLQYIGTGTITKTGDDTVETPEQALQVLAESKNVDARQKAIEVLAGTRDETAGVAVTAALNDTAPEVRAAALEALAGMGMRSALPDVLLALKDSHPGVRQSAIAAVALLGDAGNIRDLKPLTRDKDASVAAAAEIGVKKLALHRQ